MTLTRNPFDFFNHSQEFINLMQYEDTVEAMSDFIKEENNFDLCIAQLARFEKAYVVFLKKYLSEPELAPEFSNVFFVCFALIYYCYWNLFLEMVFHLERFNEYF